MLSIRALIILQIIGIVSMSTSSFLLWYQQFVNNIMSDSAIWNYSYIIDYSAKPNLWIYSELRFVSLEETMESNEIQPVTCSKTPSTPSKQKPISALSFIIYHACKRSMVLSTSETPPRLELGGDSKWLGCFRRSYRQLEAENTYRLYWCSMTDRFSSLTRTSRRSCLRWATEHRV